MISNTIGPNMVDGKKRMNQDDRMSVQRASRSYEKSKLSMLLEIVAKEQVAHIRT